MGESLDLFKEVKELKTMLVAVATGSDYDELQQDYKMLRNKLLTSSVSSKIPNYVHQYNELSAFWPYIKEQSGSYSDRRRILSEDFSSLLNELEFATPTSLFGEKLKQEFSSDYVSQQITLMVDMQSVNPTETIGKSKELIESCCKTIFEQRNESFNKNWTVSQLVRETMKLLGIAVDDMKSEDKIAKAILGNLHGIAGNIAELRNKHGSGHGKSASYTGVKERHAKLAIGSSTTLVSYLWDIHFLSKGEN